MNALRKSIQLQGRNTLSSFSRILAARYSVDTGSKEYIDGLVKNKKLVVFMKGTPASPRCGFSNAVVQILDFHGVEQYDSHDILEDENLRQGEYFRRYDKQCIIILEIIRIKPNSHLCIAWNYRKNQVIPENIKKVPKTMVYHKNNTSRMIVHA